MLKEIINFLSAPQYSFTASLIGFYLMIKHYRVVGSKKFAVGTTIGLLIFFFWGMLDPYFKAIIVWPDNIPIVILIATVLFFTWLALHKAAINDERMEKGEPPVEGTPENREKVWTWPNLVYTELFAIIAGTVFLIVWGLVFKAPLEEPANPTWAPNPAKAPWYFLGLQEMLVYFDPWLAGVVLPVLIIVGLMAIPFLDVNPKGNGYYSFKDRKFAMTGFLFGWLVLWIYLIIVGTFLRGPNWTFYGPFEFWDFHKVVAENNINISEIFWVKMLGTSMPKNLLVREVIGIIMTFAYFALIPLTKKWCGELYQKMGSIRYYLLMFLIFSMMSLPIKMVLRWLFTIKYIVALPEWELNL